MHVAHLMRRLGSSIALLLVLFATLRAEAQEARPTKPGRKYKVKIDSAPQQAAIYLDDEKYGIVGYTPWLGSLQKGSWVVIVKKDGYSDVTRTITVVRQRTTQETFLPMEKKVLPAVVEVRADSDQGAFGAEVWVDGQLQGQIPVTINVPAGRHLVEVKKQDTEGFTQWLDVKDGERTTLNPMLKGAAKGAILIDADVPDAEVLLDGNKLDDKTPTLVNNVLEGPHIVEVKKDPSLPWRQTVQVVKGQTLKVTAELKATMGGQGGTVRVISNVAKAEAYLDGTLIGTVPIDIKDIKPGDHVVEVKAKGYRGREEKVTVAAGSATVLKLDLGEQGAGVIKVVSPVPEADVFIDGEKIGTAPQEKEVSTGEHFVVVTKTGYAKFQKKLTIEKGGNVTVTAELKSTGGVRFVSSPGGAEVSLDGEVIGKTPFVNDEIAVGDHVITIRKPGFYDFEDGVKVEGGKLSVVNAQLQHIDVGPTAADVAAERTGLTSWGARALPRGHSTITLGAGYPYFVDGRFSVGVAKIADQFPLDVGVVGFVYGLHWNLELAGRLTLVDQDPFSLGVFADIGGGSTLGTGTDKRYQFITNAGLLASLSGASSVTISGRAYLQAWADRHCPSVMGGVFEKSDPADLCKAYLAGTISPADKSRVDDLLGGPNEIFNKDTGVRALVSFIVELAFNEQLTGWVIFEGVPFQSERAAFTDVINNSMFDKDFRSYIRGGITLKF